MKKIEVWARTNLDFIDEFCEQIGTSKSVYLGVSYKVGLYNDTNIRSVSKSLSKPLEGIRNVLSVTLRIVACNWTRCRN